mgnify:CR=1 FL=1
MRPEAIRIPRSDSLLDDQPLTEGPRLHRRAAGTRRRLRSMCEAALVAQTSPSRPSPRGSGSTSSIRIETTPTAIATGDARHISTVSRPLWWVARSRDRVLEDGQLVEQPDGRRAAGVAEHRGVILPRAPRGAPCREQWRARSNRSSRAPLTHHSPHTHTPTGGCSRRYWPGWAARGACGPVKRAGVLCGWDSR